MAATQGLRAQVLATLSAAQTPTDALDALTFFYTVLSSSTDVLYDFLQSNTTQIVEDMLLRVEQNLVFLLPCNDATRVAASGGAPSIEKPPGDGEDFEGYHHELAILLIRLILFDVSKPALPGGWRGQQVSNLPFLSLLNRCIASKHVSLSLLCTRIALTLVAINPCNAIALETGAVVQTMLQVLMTIIVRGKLHDPLISQPPSTVRYLNREPERQPILPLSDSILQLISSILETLQVLSICFTYRCNSIPLLIMWSTLVLWGPLNTSLVVDEQALRCTNCEVEFALRHCLSESCIQEQCYRLCEECDKVFHKSAVKRSHIRLALAPMEPLAAESWMQDFLNQIVPAYKPCVDNTLALLKASMDIREDGLPDKRRAFQTRREILSMLSLATVRGVFDDRKASARLVACCKTCITCFWIHRLAPDLCQQLVFGYCYPLWKTS